MAVYDALSNGGKEATNPIGGVKQKKQEKAERDNPTVDDYSTALGYSKEEDPLKYASAKDLLDANVTQTVTKELAMKNLNSQLNRAGLGNSGYAGIANANILNDYQAALQKNSADHADRMMGIAEQEKSDNASEIASIADLIVSSIGNYEDRQDLYDYLQGYGLTMGKNGFESNGTYDFTDMLMNEINAAYNQQFGSASSPNYHSLDELQALNFSQNGGNYNVGKNMGVESSTLYSAVQNGSLKYNDYVYVRNNSGQELYFKILDKGIIKLVTKEDFDKAESKYEILGNHALEKYSVSENYNDSTQNEGGQKLEASHIANEKRKESSDTWAILDSIESPKQGQEKKMNGKTYQFFDGKWYQLDRWLHAYVEITR